MTISGSMMDGSGQFALPPSQTSLLHHIEKPGMSVIKALASDTLNVTVKASTVIQVSGIQFIKEHCSYDNILMFIGSNL